MSSAQAPGLKRNPTFELVLLLLFAARAYYYVLVLLHVVARASS